MDYDTVVPLFFRGSERLLIIAAATLCIVLGYQLFRLVPTQKDSTGKFMLGDLSVTLTKVGPGVFFALFGVFVLYQSVQSTLSFEFPGRPEVENAANDQSAETQARSLTWMGSTDPDTLWAARAESRIQILNCLAEGASGSNVEVGRIEDAIHTAKVAILADVWLPRWGDYGTFEQLNMGAIEDASPLRNIYDAIDEDC